MAKLDSTSAQYFAHIRLFLQSKVFAQSELSVPQAVGVCIRRQLVTSFLIISSQLLTMGMSLLTYIVDMLIVNSGSRSNKQRVSKPMSNLKATNVQNPQDITLSAFTFLGQERKKKFCKFFHKSFVKISQQFLKIFSTFWGRFEPHLLRLRLGDGIQTQTIGSQG